MKLLRLAVLLALLACAYYAGYREWGAEYLINWMENPQLLELISNVWDSLMDWVGDQDVSGKIGNTVEDIKEALTK